MTNNEAIGILAIVVETAKGRCFVTDEAISDAYAMAISALQAQDSPKPTAESAQNVPKEDLISRKAVIDAIVDCTVYGNADDLKEAVMQKKAWDKWSGGVLKALEAVEDLPFAQPEQAVKDCRNCKHGNYNDHWKTHFCYNPNECTEWNLWEPITQPELANNSPELANNSPELDKEKGELHPTCTGSCTGSEELKQEVKNSTESSSTHKALDTISRQAAIDAFMTATSDGDKAEWCKWVLEQLPSVAKDTNVPCKDTISRQKAIDVCDNAIDLWHGQLGEGIVIAVKKKIEELPSVQPEIIRCRDCKYWREHKYAKETKRYIPFCGFNAIYTESDDFCSRAERRTDDQSK